MSAINKPAQISLPAEAPAVESEWDKNWAAVTKNPFEFTAWEYLLRIAENANGGITKGSSEEDVENLRLVFDHMLARFPLCFGYWKKYADWELSLVDTVKAQQIYERGVTSIQNSVELWNHYLSFIAEYYNDEEMLRELFERASQYCGYDFLAHPFWDKYIEWEEMNGRLARVLGILERVIHIPLHQYARYFEKYTQISYLRPLQELIPEETIQELDKQVRQVQIKTTETGEHVAKSEVDYQQDIRAKINEMKSVIYLETQKQVHLRWPFESEIKRPYFHVKPLDDKQLENWRKYLDFEEEKGDIFGMYTLYERCLVPCASYEEFWARYTKFLIKRDDIMNARGVFQRATMIHIPETRPAISIQRAIFEEQFGATADASGYEPAKEIFEEILKKDVNNFEVLKNFLYFELRHSDKSQKSFSSLVQHFMDIATNEKVKGALFAEKAKYAHKVEKDVGKARKLFSEAVEKYASSKLVCFSFLLFELSVNDPKMIKLAWEKIKNNKQLDGGAKQTIGRRYLDYLLETGADIEEYTNVEYFVACKRIPIAKGEDQAKRSRDDTVGENGTGEESSKRMK